MKTQLNYAKIFMETVILTVAVAIIAAAVYFFLVPSHTSVSSISGLGIVLSNFIPLPLSAITMILNVILLIIGFLTWATAWTSTASSAWRRSAKSSSGEAENGLADQITAACCAGRQTLCLLRQKGSKTIRKGDDYAGICIGWTCGLAGISDRKWACGF